MDINLIGVPLYYGCDKRGVENGPKVLRENGIMDILKSKDRNVYDLGDIYINNEIEKNPFEAGVNAKYIDEIVEIDTNLAQVVYSSLSAGAFPLTIGGDHALAAGSIAGVSKYFGDDLAVIWVDAHSDINTFETSLSGNVHGMPLAACFGVGDSKLTDLYFKGVKVKPENVFIIGARDLDPGEIELIDRLKIKVWSRKKIREIGLDNLCLELYDCLRKTKINNIHLSYDIDSIDPKEIIGTGTPVKDGFSIEEGEELISRIFETKLIKSMDFVEFNPELDKTDTTIKNCIKLIKKVSDVI
ncbi:arginase [Clostridium carnis]